MIAYLDCVGGLAGDMLLAALVDAGAPESALREVPVRLGLEGVEVKLERVERHGIGALHVDVVAERSSEEHSWSSMRTQLASAELDERVRERSLAVLQRLVEAEGAIHGVPADDVPGQFVPHQRLDQPELGQARLQLAVRGRGRPASAHDGQHPASVSDR